MIAQTVRRIVPSYSRIDSDAEVNYYWEKLVRDWELPTHISHFPGSHPVNIERKDLNFLSANPDILVSLKSDGVRYIMYMTTRKDKEDEAVCIFVDRARQMFEIEVCADASFFLNGTILDGELVWKLPDEKQLSFLVFDIIRIAGVMHKKKSCDDRLLTIERLLESADDWSQDEIDEMVMDNMSIVACNNIHDLELVPKRFISASSTKNIWDSRDTNIYRNDGLIFTRKNAEFCLGTATCTTYKWKPNFSVDVRIKDDNVYANSHNSEKYVNISRVKNQPLILVPNVLDYTNDDIVECEMSMSSKGMCELFPMRIRYDKTAPNTMKVIESVFASLQHKVSIDELQNCFA